MNGVARRALRIGRLIATALAIAALAQPAPALAGAVPAARGDAADAYMVVDCLFPGQVRRLGAKMIVQGRRMAARVTARECEIRGGEYVAYDRASHESSLQVWMPLAESGDAKAQTYVGDIFARGFGRAPDYARAAQWYAKAADQAYGPAMFSLASLYETGLGVAQDKPKADAWYRRAAGMSGPQFERVVFGPAPDPGEAGALRAELETVRGETSALRLQVRTLQAQLLSQQKDDSSASAALAADRARLERERSAVADERAALAARQQEIARQAESQGLARAADRAAAEKAAAAALNAARAQAETTRVELAALEKALIAREQALNTKLTDEREALARDRADLASRQQALEAEVKTLAERKGEASRNAGRDAAAAEAAMKKAKVDAEARLATLDAREQQLTAREKSIAAEEKKAADRTAALDKLKADLDRRTVALLAEGPAGPEAPLAPSAPPQIVLLDPEVVSTRGQPVVIAARDAAIQLISGQVRNAHPLMSLTVNGVAVRPTDAGVFGAQLPVPVDGGTLVKVVAVDGRGGRGELAFELRRAPAIAPLSVAAKARQVIEGAKLGRFHALLIGNADYQRPGWNDLRTPRDDVAELARVLKEGYGFEVETLHDATREQIGSAIFRLRERIGENDNVLIYYAGHGTFQPGPVGDRGYWIPVDGEQANPANWIASDNIHDWVGMLPARKVLVVSDSCFSGLLMRSNSAFLQAGLSADAQLALLKNEAEGRSRTYFTSGRDAPVLDQGGVNGRHSVFAQALIDSLKANQEIITGRALSARVEQTVLYLSRLATKGAESQQPDYQQMRMAGHVAGDFIFVPSGGI